MSEQDNYHNQEDKSLLGSVAIVKIPRSIDPSQSDFCPQYFDSNYPSKGPLPGTYEVCRLIDVDALRNESAIESLCREASRGNLTETELKTALVEFFKK